MDIYLLHGLSTQATPDSQLLLLHNILATCIISTRGISDQNRNQFLYIGYIKISTCLYHYHRIQMYINMQKKSETSLL